jgi:PHD/YefM family antitoxin component YafN of YafNO toxin-antitoxin module
MITPQIEAVSNLARNYKALLAKCKNGPVFLVQNSQEAAVMVSPAEWRATAAELARLRRTVEMDRQFAEIRAGNYVDYDDLDKELAKMAAADARANEQAGA